MKFDLKKIEDVLDELGQRDYAERGVQPELVLGCFIGRGVDDDSKCRSECPNRHNNPKMYEQKCRYYLNSFEIKSKKR